MERRCCNCKWFIDGGLFGLCDLYGCRVFGEAIEPCYEEKGCSDS